MHPLPTFCICWFIGPAISKHTKFEIYSFIRSRDIEAIPKFKNRSRDLVHAPIWFNFFAFLYSTHCGQSMHQFWSLYVQPFDRCSIGYKDYKSRLHDIGHALFDLVLHFWFVGLAVNPHTKLEVSNFTHSEKGHAMLSLKLRNLCKFSPAWYFDQV